MLAAWMRMKYPHIIKGAIAASAPILQFTCDCNRFNLILTSVFSTGHKYCAENIRESWNVIKNYSSTVDGRNLLKSKFKFCKNFTKPEDADRFFGKAKEHKHIQLCAFYLKFTYLLCFDFFSRLFK